LSSPPLARLTIHGGGCVKGRGVLLLTSGGLPDQSGQLSQTAAAAAWRHSDEETREEEEERKRGQSNRQ